MTGINNESMMMIGALVAMAVVMVRLVEILIGRVSVRIKNGNGKSIIPKTANPGGCRGLTPEEHAALMRLDDSHDRYDQDGTPLWYFPRSWSEVLQNIVKTQHEIAEKLGNITSAQKALLKTVERLENNTTSIARRS